MQHGSLLATTSLTKQESHVLASLHQQLGNLHLRISNIGNNCIRTVTSISPFSLPMSISPRRHTHYSFPSQPKTQPTPCFLHFRRSQPLPNVFHGQLLARGLQPLRAACVGATREICAQHAERTIADETLFVHTRWSADGPRACKGCLCVAVEENGRGLHGNVRWRKATIKAKG